MTFVSYAQNYEDVMLRRALGQVTNGFYVDIGAGDPDAESVTRLFYEAGWHGINVEPMKSVFDRLVAARPRDINLNVAVEDQSGEATYFSVDDEGGLSTGDPAMAAAHRRDGSTIAEVSVSTVTLAEVCQAHVPRDVHFLKIDVEGLEGKVLRGADFEAFRPWIIVAESLHKGQVPPETDEWESVLTAARYEFVYYDGLNRFYVSHEQLDLLKSAFSVPPNYFDDFIPSRLVALEELRTQFSSLLDLPNSAGIGEVSARLRALADDRVHFEHRAIALQSEVDALWQSSFEDNRHIAWLSSELNNARYLRELALDEREAALHHVNAANAAITDLRASTSWALTRPVRGISKAARAVLRRR